VPSPAEVLVPLVPVLPELDGRSYTQASAQQPQQLSMLPKQRQRSSSECSEGPSRTQVRLKSLLPSSMHIP
jgi:hypothetical protein